MRTTSSLEAYNKVLGDNITNRGHFFKFVHDLRGEELLKTREAQQLIESGGKTAKRRKLIWMVRICLEQFETIFVGFQIHTHTFHSLSFYCFIFLFD